MGRLKRYGRADLDADQAALFDRIARGEVEDRRPRFRRLGPDGALEGPFNARLLNPRIGDAEYSLATATRTLSTLSDRTTEMVILAVASFADCSYQLCAHEDIARSVGLTESEIDTAKRSTGLPSDDEERAALKVARSLLTHGDLDDTEYTQAISALGERKLYEIVVLVGFYLMGAVEIRVFRVEPPRDQRVR